jgi:putative redox protein
VGSDGGVGGSEAVGEVAVGPVRAVKRVELTWTGRDMEFRGGAPGKPESIIDGDSVSGPSPMDTLLLALAGCMAIDVLLILDKSRVAVEALEVEVEGTRAATDPGRYEEIRLVYRVRGPSHADRAKLDRAVSLSREKYCSVLHSLRRDIEFDIGIERL